jgi:hypothetical protein
MTNRPRYYAISFKAELETFPSQAACFDSIDDLNEWVTHNDNVQVTEFGDRAYVSRLLERFERIRVVDGAGNELVGRLGRNWHHDRWAVMTPQKNVVGVDMVEQDLVEIQLPEGTSEEIRDIIRQWGEIRTATRRAFLDVVEAIRQRRDLNEVVELAQIYDEREDEYFRVNADALALLPKLERKTPPIRKFRVRR